MKLGILQFTPGNSHDVKDLLQLAVEADKLGYSRCWLGEHYTNIDWTNPEPLLPVILGLTERIRVGTAGILLRLHSPFRVASTFKLLSAVFGDRIDLGVAGGVTANEKAIKFLTNLDANSFYEIDFDKKVEELIYYFENEKSLLEQGVIVAPIQIEPPPVWALSTSYQRGLQVALKIKGHLSRSLFHQNADVTPDKVLLSEIKAQYLERYGIPLQVNIAFAGVCAETESEAKNRFEQSSYHGNTFLLPNIIGTPDHFGELMARYEEDYGVDECIFLDMGDAPEHRLWTLEALGETVHLAESMSDNILM